MKSLSKINFRVTDEQLKPWAIVELGIDQAESSNEIDRDQILALFHNGEVNNSAERENKPHSVLHPAGIGLSLTSWQLGEIDLRPLPPDVEKEWLFVETSNTPYEDAETQNWNEETSFEKESGAILKQAHAQAEEIILKARAEAAQIILQAQSETEQEKKNGYQQGWKDARGEMQEALKAVGSIAGEMQKWQDEFMSQAEESIVEMLKEIAQTMFGKGVNLDANALQINLNRIMENAQRLGYLNIFLNPRDVNLLDPSWKEYQFLISGNKVRVIQSEKITPGGCIIKGNTGMVDGRVETQLATILNTLDELREVAE